MKFDKSQIIPFPLPEHLALFISQQLDTPIENIGENLEIKAKALHIQRKRPFGKMILRCLETTNKPVFINNGVSLYISVSKYSRINDKSVVPCRSNFLQLSKNEVEDIIDVFETFFRTSLVSFIDGASFGNYSKKRTYSKIAAIVEFLQKYNIAHDDLAVERYRKLYDREKKASKHLISRYI